jgi:uncharacterized protein YdhG (YjbR/CyaY superfamily)
MKSTKTAKSSTRPADDKVKAGFSEEERAAMKEYLQEKKRTARRGAGAGADQADGEADVLASIDKMSEPDRTMATRLHALIKTNAPELKPRTWYGMPAYARDGSVICFFQNAGKFKARYATLGFSDKAKLDEGNMWPSSFAIMQLTPAEETRIVELIKKAVG